MVALMEMHTANPSVTDVLLIGLASDAMHRQLLSWQQSTPGLHEFVPDFHRLQLEYWLWRRCQKLARQGGGRVLDIGAQNPRRWVGAGYRTFGHTADASSDIVGDLLELEHAPGGPWDIVICTEVLEHCADPFAAVRQIHAVLEPGGVLLASAPFIWPDHHTRDYPDYWRFTEQGWRLLLKPFRQVDVLSCTWTSEAATLLDLTRRFEGWGFQQLVSTTSGFLVEAHV